MTFVSRMREETTCKKVIQNLVTRTVVM